MERFLVLALILLLSGCSGPRYYFNRNYASDSFTQQQKYNADHGYCVAVSHGAIPQSDIRLNNPTPNTTTQGKFKVGDTEGRYRERTSSGNFMTGFADGYNIGSQIAADGNRQSVYSGCMSYLGWYEVPCPTCINQVVHR